MTEIYARGAQVELTIQFQDAAGDPVTPTSDPTFRFTYFVDGVKTTDTDVDFEQLTDSYLVRWDSAVADPGLVAWYARGVVQTTDGSESSVVQDEFILEANAANPGA